MVDKYCLNANSYLYEPKYINVLDMNALNMIFMNLIELTADI